MKRLHTSTGAPAEGAVYRNLSGCGSSSSGCGDCLGSETVVVITGPGCSTFPVTDNNYGALPTFFANDVEIAPTDYDDRFTSLTPSASSEEECPTPPVPLPYPDLWTQIGSIGSAFQEDVLQAGCFCLGQGITQPGITIGRPQFPRVATLPFFTIPSFGRFAPAPTRVRNYNPDGSPVKADCCPTEDTEPEYIEASIVDGEIQLTRHAKPDLEERYRADDTHTSFQLMAGYPRWCCMRDPCASSEEDKFVLRDLHFPRWPGPNSITEGRPVRNPYDSTTPYEPLGLVPRVVDIQCGMDGKVYVYYAYDIIHDGHFAGLLWDTPPPRVEGDDVTYAPLAPEFLVVNRTWRDEEVISSFTPIGEYCDQNCAEAAVAMGKDDEACHPACPADALFCSPGTYSIESMATGATEDAARTAVWLKAIADTPPGCTPEYYYECYVVYDEGAGTWEGKVKFCCPP